MAADASTTTACQPGALCLLQVRRGRKNQCSVRRNASYGGRLVPRDVYESRTLAQDRDKVSIRCGIAERTYPGIRQKSFSKTEALTKYTSGCNPYPRAAADTILE